MKSDHGEKLRYFRCRKFRATYRTVGEGMIIVQKQVPFYPFTVYFFLNDKRILSHIWLYSGLTWGSLLRNHSWLCPGLDRAWSQPRECRSLSTSLWPQQHSLYKYRFLLEPKLAAIRFCLSYTRKLRIKTEPFLVVR